MTEQIWVEMEKEKKSRSRYIKVVQTREEVIRADIKLSTTVYLPQMTVNKTIKSMQLLQI